MRAPAPARPQLRANWTVGNGFNETEYNFRLESFVNATCGCWDVPLSSGTSTTWGSDDEASPGQIPYILLPWNQSAGPITTRSDLMGRVCLAEGKRVGTPSLYERKLVDLGSDGVYYLKGTAGSSVTVVSTSYRIWDTALTDTADKIAYCRCVARAGRGGVQPHGGAHAHSRRPHTRAPVPASVLDVWPSQQRHFGH